MLEPIWHSKPATAKKAADRLNVVFNHAAALGLDVDLQAVAKAKALLGRQRHEVTSIPSMLWPDVPNFYGSLDEPTITNLALRLLILTGVAHWLERSYSPDEVVKRLLALMLQPERQSADDPKKTYEIDADLATVISELGARQAALEASMRFIGQTSSLTVLNYI